MSKHDPDAPPPPDTHQAFVERFPKLAQAWERTADAGAEGPLDDRTARLIKLAVALGAGHEGATHASVRKAIAMGIGEEEIAQVVALAASTIGLPSTVAAWTWCKDVIDRSG